jgi:hypothetical protein
LNGVLGHGVDGVENQNKAILALHEILKPGGVLLLGWNKGSMADPLALSGLQQSYSYGLDGLLPARMEFSGSTHVYDFFLSR